jgi:hypothetical protein
VRLQVVSSFGYNMHLLSYVIARTAFQLSSKWGMGGWHEVRRNHHYQRVEMGTKRPLKAPTCVPQRRLRLLCAVLPVYCRWSLAVGLIVPE